MPEHPTNLDNSRARATELATGGDGRRLDIFSLAYQTSLFSPCLKEKLDTD